MLDGLKRMITKALVSAIDDSTTMQLLKLKLDDSEVMEDVERIQNYGFTSHPPKNSEAVVGQVCGIKDLLVALVVDSAANRIKDLLEGETAFYSKFGQIIKHKADGTTEINADKVVFKCDVEFEGSAEALGVDLAVHKHTSPAGGGSTGTPIV